MNGKPQGRYALDTPVPELQPSIPVWTDADYEQFMTTWSNGSLNWPSNPESLFSINPENSSSGGGLYGNLPDVIKQQYLDPSPFMSDINLDM